MEMRGLDFIDRRILAGVRFEDVLGRPVREPVAITATPGVRWFVKGNGDVILTTAPGLAQHTEFATPPSAPALGSAPVTLDLKPAGASLAPRRAVIALPRSANPQAANPIFDPVRITLLPGSAAPAAGQVAVVQALVRRSTDGFVIEGALVRVRVPGLQQFVTTTNAKGEARVLIPGVPLANPGPNTSVVAAIDAAVDTIVVPARARFHDPGDEAAMRAAHEAEARRTRGFADPDALAAQAAHATQALSVPVAAAQTRTATIEWTP